MHDDDYTRWATQLTYASSRLAHYQELVTEAEQRLKHWPFEDSVQSRSCGLSCLYTEEENE